jgi:hypothetical protein
VAAASTAAAAVMPGNDAVDAVCCLAHSPTVPFGCKISSIFLSAAYLQVDFVGYIPNPHYSRAKAAGCSSANKCLLLLGCRAAMLWDAVRCLAHFRLCLFG